MNLNVANLSVGRQLELKLLNFSIHGRIIEKLAIDNNVKLFLTLIAVGSHNEGDGVVWNLHGDDAVITIIELDRTSNSGRKRQAGRDQQQRNRCPHDAAESARAYPYKFGSIHVPRLSLPKARGIAKP